MTTPKPYTRHPVARWHSHHSPAMRNSGDDTMMHSGRVAMYCAVFFPNAPKTLYRAALAHDDPEMWLGDMPGPAKGAYPALAAAYAVEEARIVKEYGIPQPADEWEARVICLCDKIDAYTWMMQHDRKLQFRDDWCQFIRDILDRAHGLDVGAQGLRIILAAPNAA